MERMDGTLMEVIPRLVSSAKRTRYGKIPFGNIAVRLLDCLQALHETGFLFVDVKPENFMLSKDGKTLADKIRMIDFGLVQSVKSIGGHRPNEGSSSLAGTPLYSSLHVHDGQTHSRRDDLEALGYIIGELLMKLVAAANNEDPNDVNLPWSNGTSDEHVAKLKKRDLASNKSAFYNQVGAHGNTAVQQELRNYMNVVCSLNYKETPDYEALRQVLLSLDVQGAAAAAAPAKKKKAPARKTPTRGKQPPASTTTTSARKSTRSSTRAASKRTSPESDDERVSPKIRRVIAIDDDIDDAEFFDSKPRASIDSTYETARDDETEAMDWEVVNGSSDDEQNAGPQIGIKILFTKGPHQGESLSLIKNGTETVILGSNPKAKNGAAFALPGDDQVDETHLKIDLDANKKMQAVMVTNLSSSNDTYVNGTLIASKKSRKVFISDTITIGDSTMKIQKLATNEKQVEVKKPAAAVASRMQVDQDDEEENVSPPIKNQERSTGPGVCILVTEGPCKNTSFTLTKNETPILVIGSNPTSKSEETFLIQDPSVGANHVRLELVVARKLCTVDVKDLKSSGGTLVNSTTVKAGKVQKAFMNDSIHIGDTVLQIKTL